MPPKNMTKKCAPKLKNGPRGMKKPIPAGLVMTDLMKKQWKLGPVIGQGGFGYIYLGDVSSNAAVSASNSEYVIKVEPHANGPLFVELHFYQRVAKAQMVKDWLKDKKFTHIGLPLFIGTGSFEYEGDKYRFMVMDRYSTDLEKIYEGNDKKLPEKTVFSLGLRIVDVLEYLHDNEYVHADIKSSNLMMGYKKGDTSKVYLLDYGLAYRFQPAGVHVVYKEDPKRKHDGTIEYTSRDAHRGAAPSRRGDMEILAYCMVQWLCSKLPWEDKLNDKDYVFKQKDKYMGNVKELMSWCFEAEYPAKLKEYIELINKLDYAEKPNYNKIRKIFEEGLKKSGCNDDGRSVLLPTEKPQSQKESSGSGPAKATPRKQRAALKDLPIDSPSKPPSKPTDSDFESSSTKKRRKSPAKRTQTPRKRVNSSVETQSAPSISVTESEASPVKKTKAIVPVRRSPRRRPIVSNSSDDGNDSAMTSSDVTTATTLDVPSVVAQDMRKVINGVGDVINGVGDRVVVVDGVEKTIHRRVRRKNVPTRDFAQSP